MKSLALSLALLGAVATNVAAQPSKAQAEMLFKQAKQAMADKKFAEACDAFDASQKLDASLATALNQADCREKNGQLATAYGLFTEAQRTARSSSDPNAAAMEKVSGDRAAKLEPRLSKLTITVATKGATVTRNGEVVDPALWGRALPVDGGKSTIVAKLAGKPDWTGVVTVANESDSKTVSVPDLTAPTVVVPPIVTDPMKVKDTHAPATQPARPASAPSKAAPIAFSVGAGVLAIGAVVMELNARSSYDDAKIEVDDAEQADLWHSANTKRYIAEGAAIGALACTGVAIWLFIRHPSQSTDEHVSLAPLLTSDSGGVVFMRRW